MKIITKSAAETKKFAAGMAKKLKKGDILCLQGGLGSGKTTFIQGIAKGFGVKEIPTSPTFVLMNIYKGRLPLYHFDIYRAESAEEIVNIGYEEFFYGNGVAVVEWAERLKELMPDKYTEIKFKMLVRNKREITVRQV